MCSYLNQNIAKIVTRQPHMYSLFTWHELGLHVDLEYEYLAIQTTIQREAFYSHRPL